MNPYGAMQYHGSAPVLLTPTPLIHTLPQAIINLDPQWKWAIEYLEWNTDPSIIAEYIRTGQAKNIADGSFKILKGTAAFAIVGPNGQSGIYGMQRTPEPSYSQ
jgi:hypothetical protein